MISHNQSGLTGPSDILWRHRAPWQDDIYSCTGNYLAYMFMLNDLRMQQISPISRVWWVIERGITKEWYCTNKNDERNVQRRFMKLPNRSVIRIHKLKPQPSLHA